ncbi:TetR/AcrR family transcriptional regulator [Streptomyces sp. V4-01]|uniref:TetR/AcrR family transcriptional regulator n=1 Tax=Actinacidiphila polyblastidii TaxID=3110430 RepID=A0ABU7PL14_9ACTN|nr:TetR/AcrR family transcriptional regulator [Streptomyces sp. V4-01]
MTTPGSAQAKPPPRERLLDAAADLFYRRGTATGVDALCKAAGVSKRSMYQLFAGKDEVLAAALERIGPPLEAALLPPPDAPADPRARILYVFERMEEAAAQAGYHGCPYLSAQVELKDPAHQASVVAARNKQQMTAHFLTEAERAGAADPELVARRLMVVYDGASARAGIGSEHLDGLSAGLAALVLDAAGITGAGAAGSGAAG